nr:hypothetical protein [uncultured Cupriavidus sp.]
MSKDDCYFGKTIAEHRDAGTCWLCGGQVERAQGYHGATGAHWACSKALMTQFAALNHTEKSTPILARANGGFFVHTVDPVTRASLCGHKPKDTARQMRPRARWIPLERVPRGLKRCPHCARILASAGQAGGAHLAAPPNSASANHSDRDTRTRDLFEEEVS